MAKHTTSKSSSTLRQGPELKSGSGEKSTRSKAFGPFFIGWLFMVGGVSSSLALLYLFNDVITQQLNKSTSDVLATKVNRAKNVRSPEAASKPKPPQKTRPRPKANHETLAPTLSSSLQGFSVEGLATDFGDQEDSALALLKDVQNLTLSAEQVDQKPVARQRAAPTYPRSAQKRGLEGYVLLSLLISESGRVLQTKVIESEPAGLFEGAAIASVRQWLFEPARYQGKPVQVWSQQYVRFDLQ